MRYLTNKLAPLALVLLVTGCASGPPSAKPSASASARGNTALPADIPADVQTQYSNAQTLMSVEDYAGAVQILQPLVQQHQEYPGAATTLAIALRKLARADEALALLETTLVNHDSFAPGWNEVGILHREAGRFEQAEAAYMKAVTVNPDYALAHLNLGILLDLYLARHAQALEHYERYQSLLPDEDKLVKRWIADISRRIDRNTQAARANP